MKLMHRNLAGKLTVFFAALLLMLLVHAPAVHAAEKGYYSLKDDGGTFCGYKVCCEWETITNAFL